MGYYFDCQEEMIIIASIFEVIDGTMEMLFIDNDKQSLDKYAKQIEYVYPNSDHLAILELYKLYKKNEIQYLNIDTFEKIDNQYKIFRKYISKLKKI